MPLETIGLDSSEKVIHVIGALVAGGAEKFVVELVRELHNRGDQVALIVLSNRRDPVGDQMLLDLEASGVKTKTGPTDRVRIKTLLWYIRTLYDERPTILHLHTPNTELAHYLATWVYKLPHRMFRTIHSEKMPSRRIFRFAMSANKVSRTVACGVSVRDARRNNLTGRVTVVENGIRFTWPVRTQGIASEAKRKRGFDCYKVHFLIAGRMNDLNLASSPKGHDVLVNAWKQGRLRDKGCILHILGDGNLRAKLECLGDGDDSIVFHGIQPRIHEWLLAADCFVMPSRYEGLPIAGIEAAGTGLPCVFSDISPLKELNVSHALLVPVGDAVTLSQALLGIAIKRPAVDMAEVVRFRERFDIKHTARRYIDVYAS